jgi:hypothetical protein
MLTTANPRILGGAFFGMLLFAALLIHAQTAQQGRAPTTPASRAPTAPLTHAQGAALTVRVEEPGQGAQHYLLPPINLDVIKAFSERIATSDRYALIKAPAELVVFIVCVDSGRDTPAEVDFCTYKFEYRSKKAPEFDMPLGTPNPIAGVKASEIAENIFQAFLTETTEAKLSVAELEPTFRVAEFCSKPANQAPCSGKFQ